MTAPEGAFIDQIFFRYVIGDQNGLQPVASSLSTTELPIWKRDLDERIRLQPASNGFRPDTALSYCVFGTQAERAAVVWRFDKGETDGRNDSRALVGPSAALTSQVATSLEAWPGWNIPLPNAPMERLRSEDLLPTIANESWMHEHASEERYQRIVAEMLGHMLAKPRDPVSLIGITDLSPTVIVWALREAGGKALAALGAARKWTFSTWEVRHDNGVEGLPEIVFLPEQQRNPPSSISRVWVDFSRDQRQLPREYEHAYKLVRHRLFNEAPPQPLTPVPVRVTQGVGGLAETQHLDQRQGELLPEQSSPQVGGLRPQDAYAQRPRAGGEGNGPIPTDNGRSSRSSAPQNVRRAQPGGGSPYPDPLDGVIQALVGAETIAEFEARLKSICGAANTTGLRGRARSKLYEIAGFDRVAPFIEEKAPAELTEKFVVALFGKDGIDISRDPQARQDAAVLIARTESPQLARKLVRIGIANEGREILQAGVDRMDLIESGRTRGRSRAAARIAQIGAGRNFRMAVAGCAVLALLAAFFAGSALLPHTTQTLSPTGNQPPTSSQPSPQPAPPVASPVTVQVRVPELPKRLTWTVATVDNGKSFGIYLTVGAKTVGALCDAPKPAGGANSPKSVSCPLPSSGETPVDGQPYNVKLFQGQANQLPVGEGTLPSGDLVAVLDL